MKKIPFHGILAVGNTKREATNNYRLLALGKGVTALRDEDSSMSFVSNASSLAEIFNPSTGDLDLVKDPAIAKNIEFASNSSASVEANHVVCSSGCGTHVVFDSEALVKFCPVCTTSLSAEGDEEEDDAMSILNDLDEGGDGGDEDADADAEGDEDLEEDADAEEVEGEGDEDLGEDEEGEDEAEASDDEDEDDLGEDEEGEGDDEGDADLSDEDDSTEDDGSADEEEEDGVVAASDSKEGAIRLFMTEVSSISSDKGMEINYVVCSNKSCKAHIIHDVKKLKDCPVCHSSVEEPEDDGKDMELEVDGPEVLPSASIKDGSEEDGTMAKAGDEGDDEDMGEEDLSLEDESDEGTDDAGETVVASTKAGAIRKYFKKKGISNSSAKKQVEYSVCSDADCGMHIMSDKSIELCPVCANEVVDPEGETEVVEPAVTDEETDESKSSAKKIIIKRKAKKVVAAEQDIGEEEVVDPELETEDSGDEEGMGDEEVAEESCESAAKPAKKAEKKPAKKPVKKATASDDEEEGGEEGGEEVDDADFGDDEEDAEDASESSVQAGTTKINTLKLFKGDQADAYTKLDVSFSASVNGKPLWTAFYAGKPVATARVENVGKNQDLFDKPAFGQAVLAGAKHAGVKKILLDMGFKPIVHKLSVSAEVKRMVEKQIAKERTAIASGQSEYAERYCAALATAAIGINRGFFSGIKNPLKQALCGSLESIGVRNPAQLVDNVMKTNFEPFQKAAHEKALEILGKPAEVQQSLAKTVLETEYQAASESSSTLEDKLSSLGTAHPAAPVHESKSATVIDFNQDLSLAVGTLGKR